MHPRLHLGKVERISVQVQGHRGGVGIQGEEAVEGKLLRVWGNSGGIVLEGAHGEAERKKCTADEEGGNLGGGNQ